MGLLGNKHISSTPNELDKMQLYLQRKINTKPDKETVDAWRKNPANWTPWNFYYNPKDKRLFPPTRWTVFLRTVNYANPYSVLVNGILVISAILLLVLFFQS